jgi:hypothetical protein
MTNEDALDRIRKARAAKQAEQESIVPDSEFEERAAHTPNFYCLDSRHSPHIATPDRFFTFDGEGCPVCPVCKDRFGKPKQVNAHPVEPDLNGIVQIPQHLVTLDQRLTRPIP